MNLILVRHGESETNKELHEAKLPDAIKQTTANPPLTRKGEQQAQITAHHLLTLIDQNQTLRVMHSELDRSKDTATPFYSLLEMHKIPFRCEIRPDLNEKSEAIVGVKNNEPLIVFIERVKAFLATLSPCDNEHLIIIGHSVFISVMTSLLINPGAELTDLEYSNQNCAITRFRNGFLEYQGNVDHLPKE